MGIFFIIPVGILLIGLVSLVSPNARSFSIPMIIVGAVLNLALLIFFFVGYLKGRNIKKYINGNYYVVESTNQDEKYRLFLSSHEYKEGDYFLYKERSIPNDSCTVVLKVKSCYKLTYKSDKDNNFPVDRFEWSLRENIESFSNEYIFCKLHFGRTSNGSEADTYGRITKYTKRDNEKVFYAAYVDYYDRNTHSRRNEKRTNGIITETYDFEKLFDKNQMIILEQYPIRERKIEILKPKPMPIFVKRNDDSHPSCIVVGVCFDGSTKEYNYLSNTMLKRGEYIDVPTHEGMKRARVMFCREYSSFEKLPYAYSKMKNVKDSPKSVDVDYGDYYDGPDYPDYDDQEAFEAELDRISERAEQAAEDGYYFDDYGVFHDLSED